MPESLKVLLICLILLLIAPAAGIVLSVVVIGLLVGLSVWGVWKTITMPKHHYCPECVETRLHPQPFIDNAGRLLCGACWFIDGQEVEMIESYNIFPDDITGET